MPLTQPGVPFAIEQTLLQAPHCETDQRTSFSHPFNGLPSQSPQPATWEWNERTSTCLENECHERYTNL